MKAIVTNDGCLYSSYETLAEIMGLKNFEKHNSLLHNGDEVEIINKHHHLIHPDRILYGVRRGDGKEFIIEDRGVELKLVKQIEENYTI